MKLSYFKALGLIFIGVLRGYGQEFEYPVTTSGRDLTIQMQVGYTELMVSGSSENDIKIKLLNKISTTDKRAEGLTPVTPWPDNTGSWIHVYEEENIIYLIKTSPRSDARYEVTVPAWTSLIILENEWGSGNFLVSGIKGNVRIESNSSDISLKNIGGSVDAETTSGNMEIELPPSAIGAKHEINSVSGKTHLLVERDSQYSFDLSTVSGSIRAEFELVKEIEYKGSKLKRISKPKEITTDLNGGGDKIVASTVSGLIDVSFIK